ncbi:MAG TPA: ABC transporter permease [Caldilineae bacterium]|jgi:ABC-2 type transport system permease protein|nr:ABC transporter permease [Caldilineae bacterium]
MIYRILALVGKELTQLRRNWPLALFIIFGPMMELVAVAYATSQEIANLPTAVLDYDRTQASRDLITALRNTGTFRMTYWLEDGEAIPRLLDAGKAAVAVVIPKGFGEALTRESVGRPEVQVILDGADPPSAQAAMRSVQGAVARMNQELMVRRLGPAAAEMSAFDPSVRVWFNEELREANYTVPSELGFILYFVALMIASLGIARERELGTLEQLVITPLRSVELIIGKTIPAILLAYIEFLLLLAVTIGVFRVPMRGSWPLLLGIAFFYLFVELGWGIMISAISRTQQQALLLVFVLAMGEMVFSGYMIPVETLPGPLRVMSNFVPIRHFLIILRGILLKGSGLQAFWYELGMLAFLGSLILIITFIILRRLRWD